MDEIFAIKADGMTVPISDATAKRLKEIADSLGCQLICRFMPGEDEEWHQTHWHPVSSEDIK